LWRTQVERTIGERLLADLSKVRSYVFPELTSELITGPMSDAWFFHERGAGVHAIAPRHQGAVTTMVMDVLVPWVCES
jgi:hypothetical protein